MVFKIKVTVVTVDVGLNKQFISGVWQTALFLSLLFFPILWHPQATLLTMAFQFRVTFSFMEHDVIFPSVAVSGHSVLMAWNLKGWILTGSNRCPPFEVKPFLKTRITALCGMPLYLEFLTQCYVSFLQVVFKLHLINVILCMSFWKLT